MTQMEWLKRSKAHTRKRNEALRSAEKLTVSFSGDELMNLLQQAAMLNRRMLDRSPEHGLFDRAFTLVLERLHSAFDQTPEGQVLVAERKVLSDDFLVAFPAAYDKSPEEKP